MTHPRSPAPSSVAHASPIMRRVLRWLRRAAPTRRSAFTAIYRLNDWNPRGQGESVSGPGSSLARTAAVRAALPDLLRRHDVTSMLDAPCGDANWIATIDLNGVRYTGADIVRPLLEANRRRHAARGWTFVEADVVDGVPAGHDLVLCRDCLVHLRTADVAAALRAFSTSGARLLLTTTFPAAPRNRDLRRPGDWRPLDLTKPPFSLPAPIELVDERLDDPDPVARSKALGLWRLPLELGVG